MEVKSCTLFLVLMFATCSLLCQGGGIVYDENGPEVPDTTVPAEVNEPVDVVTVAAPQGEDCGPIQEEISSLRQRVGLLLAALTQHFGDDFQVGEPAGETTQQSPTTEEPEADGECPEIAVCTLEYNPVCGSNGVSYGNPCQFEFAQCKEPSLTSTPGECVTDPDSCGKPCPRDYRPVCGSDGNTYSNQCLFEIELCKNPNLTFEEGECISTPGVEGECPEIAVCTLEYNPVCGSNGVSYGNPCQFEFAQCKEPSLTSTPGECVTDPDSCGKPCPRDYRPVCGSDGNTYSNQCLFEIELCKNPNLTFEEGECISTPGVEDPCAEVECDELPCPEDLQHTYGGNCCPECPQDWGLDPCQLSGTCVVPPTPAVDPCADVECDELPCPEDLQRTYEGNCCPECPQDWGLDPCVLSGTCQVAPTPAVDPASCEKPCPKIYRPVCGSDGNTYSNECLFDIEKCKNPTLTSQEGVCSPSPTVKDPASCERPCTKIYRPVCGSDGNTYSNVCLFDIEKCKNPTLTSQEGVCSPSPTLEDPCADVECVELPCPKDLQYTYESNCCPECPQDWGVDPCVLSGTCGVLPTIDPCADVECFELSCPEDLQHKYEGNCCPECPQDWELDPCEWSGTCRRIGVEVLPPTSCSDLTTSESGVYEIFPIEGGDPVSVFCDFDTVNGPWTVIQRRIDGSVNFYLTMADYQAGFGNLDGEFWFGLDNIYSMVSQGSYQLRIDLQAGSGLRKFAIYNDFSISDESDGYRLSVGGFSGNARNSLTYHNGMQFSTRDVDNDINTKKSCARFHKGAWWYKKCLRSNLNGRYRDPAKKHPDGLIWAYWRGYTESMTFVEMKIRPTA